MLEIGGITRLHLVEMAFGKDIFGSIARNGIALFSVGVVHGEKVVAVGIVECIPIDLGDLGVTGSPRQDLIFIFQSAMGMAKIVARQILVVIGTWAFVFTPFEARLPSPATEIIERCVELGAFVGCPIPCQLHKRLMISAHTRIANHLLAIFIDRLVAPVRVVVIGANQIVNLLHHRR